MGQFYWAASIEQRPSQFDLQGFDGVTQRWLTDAASLGCAGEIEVLTQGKKVPNLIEGHRRTGVGAV
jgi:hypothetical protein